MAFALPFTTPPPDYGTPDWSLSVTNPGAVVTDEEDIAQCIILILQTIRGSDPLRPEFGTDIRLQLDRPFTTAAALVIAQATVALATYEPRIVVLSVTPEMPDPGHYQITIEWRRKNAAGPAKSTAVII